MMMIQMRELGSIEIWDMYEWEIWKEVERSRRCKFSYSNLTICLERLREIIVHVNQDSWSPVWYPKPGTIEYESRVTNSKIRPSASESKNISQVLIKCLRLISNENTYVYCLRHISCCLDSDNMFNATSGLFLPKFTQWACTLPYLPFNQAVCCT